MKKFIGIFITVLISACSATNTTKFQAEPAPSDQQALLYLYRSSAFSGTETRSVASVKLNDEAVGQLRRETYLPIRVEAGLHKLSVRSSMLGKDRGYIYTDQYVSVGAGQTRYIRYSESIEGISLVGSQIYANTDITLTIVNPEIAESELLTTRMAKR